MPSRIRKIAKIILIAAVAIVAAFLMPYILHHADIYRPPGRLEYITYSSAYDEEPRYLMFLLQGGGHRTEDIMPVAEFYARFLPPAVFIIPRAPLSVLYPGKITPSPAWYEFFHAGGPRMEERVKEMRPLAEELIRAKMAEYNLGYEEVIIWGYSQGATVALYAVPRLEREVRAMMLFSPRLTGAEDLHLQRKPPVFIYSRRGDGLVPASESEKSRKALEDAQFSVQAVVAERAGHAIGLKDLEASVGFLKSRLAEKPE